MMRLVPMSRDRSSTQALSHRLLLGAGLLSSALGAMALIGWMAHRPVLARISPEWAPVRMGLPTAIATFAVSGALLVWAWESCRRVQFDFSRWLPITASVTLMAMVACVSAVSLVKLKTSIYWRKHTYEVLASSEAMFAELLDSQRGMRGYVLTRHSASLALYRDGMHGLPKQLAQLREFTRDNPSQQARIAMLSRDVDSLVEYSRRLLTARDASGIDAAIALEATGEGRILVDHMRADLDAFSNAEHRLLVARDSQAQLDFHNTTVLLVTGSVCAALLLLLAHWMTGREASRRRQMEAQIRLSEERFRHAFDEAPIGMCLVSLDGRFLKVNRALCSMLGYSEGELLHTDFQAITQAQDLRADLDLVGKVLSGEIPSYQMEKRYRHRDGSVVYANLSVSLVRDRDDAPLYFVSQIENIAHRREMDRLKHEFISTVSHELRTPLTSIRGSLGLVEAGVLGTLPEKAQGMIKIAHQNSERLVRIINDILDVEKIESGKLQLHTAPIAIADFLRQSLDANAAYGEKFRVRFVLEEAPPGARVLADPDRLMQVMSNLLSNAAKFSPADAQVEVRAHQDGGWIHIAVQDHGTGIPESFRSRIFEKFAQADASSSRRFDGTGLGLSITQHLIHAMGGSIGFQTALGEGTLFSFKLPTAQAPVPHSATGRHRVLVYGEPDSTQVRPQTIPRILHVEDDPDLSRVIEMTLAGRADVVTAPTLEAAQQHLRQGEFSLIVLDVGLPDGSGLALLEAIEAPSPRRIPVVILSVTEVSAAVRARVAAALVKSRLSEGDVVNTILSLVPA